MNDEILIWEAYNSSGKNEDNINEPQKQTEMTEDEVLSLLMKVGGLSSLEDAKYVLDFSTSHRKWIVQKSHNGNLIIPDDYSYKVLFSKNYIEAVLWDKTKEEKKQKRETEQNSIKTDNKPDPKILGLFYTDNSQILFHAGTRLLKVSDIEFDRGALGFHLGTEEQMEYISKGTYKKNSGLSDRQIESGKRLKVSKFLVSPKCGESRIEFIESDLPWEDPPQLVVYLYWVGCLERNDVEAALSVFGYEDNREVYHDENDLGNIFYDVLDKIDKKPGMTNYIPVDDIPRLTEWGEFYKDKEALGYVRNLLIEKGYAGFVYENVGEGSFVSSEEDQYSLCVLDKCILKDVESI